MESYVTIDYRHHPVDEPRSFVIRFQVLLKNGEDFIREIKTSLAEFGDGYFDQGATDEESADIVAADLWERSIAEPPRDPENVSPSEEGNGPCFSNDLVAANARTPPVITLPEVVQKEVDQLKVLRGKTFFYSPIPGNGR